MKKNCWEVKKCGREQGGTNAEEFGVCQASLPNDDLNAVNRGLNAGRACWVVAGTLCGGEVQGAFAQKLQNCMECEFMKMVHHEEGRFFVLSPQRLKSESKGKNAPL